MTSGTVPGREYGRFDLPQTTEWLPRDGDWLSLADVLQDTTLVERILYRMVGDGKLRSREGDSGDVQIWVRDEDRGAEPSAPPGTVTEPTEVALPNERGDGAIAHGISLLLAPLSASHERNLQLAYENGSLKERMLVQEHELQALRGAALADKRTIQHVTDRLRAMEARQEAAFGPAAVSAERRSLSSIWWLLALVPGLALCLGVAAIWILGWRI